MAAMTARLGQLAAITAGQPAPQSTEDFGTEGLPFIRAGNLAALVAGYDTDRLERVSDAAAARNRLRRVEADSVLFAKSGMSAKIGHVYLLQQPAYVVSHLAIVTPGPDLDSGYLRRWLEENPPSRLIPNDSYPSIRLEEIGRLQIPLPPLAEQRRIAAILDKADAIRRKRRCAIELAEGLLNSVFLETFGDPMKNPKGWPTAKLGDLITDGPQNGLYRPAEDYGSGTPIVRIDSFYAGELTGLPNLKRVRIGDDLRERYRIADEDILVNRVNSPKFVGKSAIVPKLLEPTVFESNMMRLRADSSVLNPHFLINFLQQPYVRKQILTRTKDAVNQSSINQDDVQSLQIRVPPLDLQSQFATLKERARGLRARLERAAGQDESLFRSLDQAVFGEGLGRSGTRYA